VKECAINEHKPEQPFEKPSPFLVAGLGNPGKEYRDTRHNVGFMLLDRMAEKLRVTFSRVEMRALVTKAEYEGRKLVLAKPQTYMNLSGKSVASLARFYKIPASHLLVIYDEVDLPFGTLRIRPAGGSAGHKGMGSIVEALGTDEFPRLRIGIGRPAGRKSAADYVLQDLSKDEQVFLLPTLDRAVEAVFTFINSGVEAAMNQFNASVEE
jgi:peptidyl-tRNA hydrolase, PTH1 family